MPGGLRAGVEAAAVVADLEPDAVVAQPQVDPGLARPGVTRHVVERLLRDAVQRRLHVRRQLLAPPLDAESHVGADPAAAGLDEVPQQLRERVCVSASPRISSSIVRMPAREPRVSRRSSSTAFRARAGSSSISASASALRLAANSDCVTESCRSRARRVRSASTAVSSMRALSRAFSMASAAWSANARAMRTWFSSSEARSWYVKASAPKTMSA